MDPYYYGVLRKDEFLLPDLEYGKLVYGALVEEVFQKGILHRDKLTDRI